MWKNLQDIYYCSNAFQNSSRCKIGMKKVFEDKKKNHKSHSRFATNHLGDNKNLRETLTDQMRWKVNPLAHMQNTLCAVEN